MYKAVISFCSQNADIITSIPALQSAFTAFKGKVESINNIAREKAKNITGFAADKTQFRKALSLLAASIASSVSAYASAVNDVELAASVKVTASDLLRLRDINLVARCNNILRAVIQNLEALADYNITQLTVTNFDLLIKEYDASIPRPRNAASERAAHGVSLKALFQDADKILKMRMDKLIATLKTIKPEFYLTYKNNRLIIDPRTTHAQIKGVVTDSSNGAPLAAVTILIVENKVTVSTGKEGRFIIKPIGPGTYTIKAIKDGFHAKTIERTLVKAGQTATVNVEMVPAV
jgi:hypothetical protein